MNNIKLGVVLDEPFFSDGDSYYSYANWYYFADAISAYFYKSTLYIPLRKTTNIPSDIGIVNIKNMSVQGGWYYDSFKSFFIGFFFNRRKIVSFVHSILNDNDIIIVRLPNALTPYILKYNKQYNRKIITIVAGNIVTQSNVITNGGILSKIALPVVKFIASSEHNLARSSKLVITYGDELKDRFVNHTNNIINTRTAMVLEKELFFRDDTFTTPGKVNVIRVATIIRSKGIDLFIIAMHAIMKKYSKIDFFLHIVGRVDDHEYYAEINEYISLNGLKDKIKFYGFVPFGSELFKLYIKSDVQLITSSSEGIPRAIIEGASMSLPLITTNVGGISNVVVNKRTGLLLDSNSVDSIVHAFDLMYNDHSLRRRMIKESFCHASSHTIEKASLMLAKVICK